MTEQKKALTAVDKATKGMITATTGLQKAVAELSGLSAISEELAQEIEFKQSEFNALGDTYKEKERKEKAELNLRIIENEDKVLNELLKKNGLIYATTDSYDAMTTEIDNLKRDNSEQITSAVSAAEAELTSAHRMEITNIKSAQSVETANLKAEIKALESQCENLEVTVADLRNMLEKEREARVTVAQASQPVFNMPKSGS